MSLYTASALSELGIVHGTTGRTLGNMRLAGPTADLFHAQAISETSILRFKQIHSDHIVEICSDSQAKAAMKEPLPQADGWILTARGWGAAILTADCAPLILWDQQASVLGLAHCGWRGVAAGLPAKMVQRMKAAGAQGNLAAWIGPHIQACCFEVQADVAAQFSHTMKRDGKLFVDLNHEITKQLTGEGLGIQDLFFSPHCTCCQPKDFFSFRREHTKEAMLTFVYLPNDRQAKIKL